MSEQKVANRKVITFAKTLAATIAAITSSTNSWSEKINLSFTPDIVIVRQIMYKKGTDGGTGIYTLYTDMVADNNLVSFMDDKSECPQTVFKVGKQLTSDYTFRVDSTLGTLSPSCTGSIKFVLEFVQT